jgi:histidinol-phosphate aminotransferase
LPDDAKEQEIYMSVSRRQFLKSSAVATAAVPMTMAAGIDYCEASTDSAIDLSMGFPPGAIRLNYNENTLGPSPKAIEGAVAGVRQAYRYALSALLKSPVADYHDIDADQVLMGTGSSEILRLTPVAFGRDGGNVVTGLETWGGLLAVADNLGLDVRRFGLRKDFGYAFDVERMLSAVDSETRIFMVVSPNNPTGATLSYAEIKHIADSLPSEVLFVLDQAYIHYYDGGRSGLDLVREGYRNVLVTQTFSKAFGLAGLRCGYGMAHADVLNEIRKFGTGPASINIAGYGAILGSLDDPEHATRSRDYVHKTRKYYQQQFAELGVNEVSGPPPFMLFETGDRSQEIYDELLARKIFITHGKTWNMPDYLRVSYGRESENAAFFAALQSIL